MSEMNQMPRGSVYISPADVSALAKCGLSPVQLVEQRDELLSLVRAIHEDMTSDYGNDFDYSCLAAALAKCEGVKL